MRPNPITRRPARPRVERICHHCLSPFMVAPHKIDNGHGLYCSRACQNLGRTRPLADRFWEKVDRTGVCWLWLASGNELGYGTFVIGNRKYKAHRVAWELVNGPIPDGVEVCHNCPGGDNPACVNPAHLFLGTHTDNLHDASVKGRMHFGNANGSRTHPERVARGEMKPNAKLNPDSVREIRTLASQGVARHEIARRYAVHIRTVRAVILRRTWAHVT